MSSFKDVLMTTVSVFLVVAYIVVMFQIITDLFRRRLPARFGDATIAMEDGEVVRMEELAPSADAGPEAALVRRRMVEALEQALRALPEEQRAVFVAHEIDGRSFKDIAAETGVNLNTLLARKRYAVLHLRKLLQQVFDEM